MPATFTGVLNSNEIFASLYNMIISQQVYSDNVAGTYGKLVDSARVDGTLYGDTKLYYATDALASYAWGNDDEAENLLSLNRPKDPEIQKITLDVFRQIRLTVDNYLSKRAWSDEGSFSNFQSVMMAWINDTKRIYDSTTYNVFIGTTVSSTGKQTVELPLAKIRSTSSGGQGLTGEEANRVEAETIAQGLADLFVELSDVSRDYNDYGFVRSYNESDLIVVWNSKFVNKIKKIDLPTIFHKDGLMDKFDEYTIPSRYFGVVNASGGTTASTNTTVRALHEGDWGGKHLFAGDLLPNATAYTANTTYTVDDDVICKIMHKNSVPFMSAFEVGTSFFNPRSLTENHYLTWGHNTLDYLAHYPFITVESD